MAVQQEISNTRARLRRRVRKGAALLDRECPGWEKKIDMSNLQMSSGSRCILGQVFVNGFSSGYYKGIAALRLVETNADDRQAQLHGFNLGDEDLKIFIEGQVWDWLAGYWIREINNRRATA